MHIYNYDRLSFVDYSMQYECEEILLKTYCCLWTKKVTGWHPRMNKRNPGRPKQSGKMIFMKLPEYSG